jgi:predicted ABC-class ATPase
MGRHDAGLAAIREGGRICAYATLQEALTAREAGRNDTAIEQHRGAVLVMRLLPPLPLGSLNAYRDSRSGSIPRAGLSREEIIARARHVFGEEAVMQIVNGHGRVFLADGNVLRFANMHQLLDHAEQHAARSRK